MGLNARIVPKGTAKALAGPPPVFAGGRDEDMKINMIFKAQKQIRMVS
jgi:hypothetical protein